MSYLNRELKWLIYSKFPDGTNDIYYPYLFTKDNVEPKHISEISENDILKVHLNYFDYEYLASSHDRFRIYLCSETEKRLHPLLGKYSPRPYLLEDIEKIIELWEILSNRRTKSQIKKLEYVCASKIREWNLEDKNIADNFKFKEFVTSSVKNICENLDDNAKQVIISSILSGMFFDVIELFMTLESEIGGDNSG